MLAWWQLKKLNWEGKFTGRFIAMTNYQLRTPGECALCWYDHAPASSLIKTLTHTGRPRECRASVIPATRAWLRRKCWRKSWQRPAHSTYRVWRFCGSICSVMPYSRNYPDHIVRWLTDPRYLTDFLLLTYDRRYAPKVTPDRERASIFFESCLVDLRNWSYDLLPNLKIEKLRNSSRSPHIFILHMVHHTAFILAAKYFIASRNAHNGGQSNVVKLEADPDGIMSNKASRVCYSSAREICAVAMKYRHTFGSFRQSPITATHCTLSAALVILQKIVVGGNEGVSILESDKSNMNLCLTILEELSQAWHPARRLRLYLQKLLCMNDRQVDILQLQSSHTNQTVAHQDMSGDLGKQNSFGGAFRHDTMNAETEISFQNTSLQECTSGTPTDYAKLDLEDFGFDFLGPNLANDFSGIFQDITLPMDYLQFDNLWGLAFSIPVVDRFSVGLLQNSFVCPVLIYTGTEWALRDSTRHTSFPMEGISTLSFSLVEIMPATMWHMPLRIWQSILIRWQTAMLVRYKSHTYEDTLDKNVHVAF